MSIADVVAAVVDVDVVVVADTIVVKLVHPLLLPH
jgi:hypothetical protein